MSPKKNKDDFRAQRWGVVKRSSTTPRWLLSAIIFVFLASLGGAIAFVYAYDQRIYPGIFIGPVSLGGLTQEEARKKINLATDNYLKNGLVFKTPERRAVIESVIIAPKDPDLYYAFVSFDADKMIDRALRVGRESGSFNNLRDLLTVLTFKKIIPLDFNLDKERLLNALEQNFAYLEELPVEARWKITFGPNNLPRFNVIEEKPGNIFRYDEALRELEESAALLSPREIELKKKEAKPKIIKEDVAAAIPEAQNILARAPLNVVAADKNWKISKETVAQWLVVKKTKEKVAVALDADAVKTSLKEWGKAYGLEQEPQNAKFRLENNKVIEFQTSINGAHIGSDANTLAISKALANDAAESQTVVLATETVEPEFRTDEVNTFGIKELIGIATTSFAGSPKNRRHNIKVALEKLNGLIIAPGEEFSLNKAIGSIDADAGFKEELVIKGDKTIPEFGGGLCQIATTIFRTALKAGLPILERQNHSYRVPYYEPPVGMDATIYLPKPDFIFKNDTGAAILILGNISGNNLSFEFWGASDGRIAETSKPVVTNITPPPPPKLVMTDELPPGIKKCTEKAHVGSDASFVYTITRPDGTKEEQTFRSHYRPWQEVCLVGVAPGMATSTEKTASQE